MASLPNVGVKRKIFCQQYINVWLSMMSGCGENPFFLVKKKIIRPEHSLTPHPLLPVTSHFCFTPPTPFKVDVICVSPLTSITALFSINRAARAALNFVAEIGHFNNK